MEVIPISKRVQSIAEVKDMLARLKYAIKSNPSFKIIVTRKSDEGKQLQYTNKYTLDNLFPNESPAEALRNELVTLSVEEYKETLTDDLYPEKDLHVFIRQYDEQQVFIKIRAELLTSTGRSLLVVISFHFAEYEVKLSELPHAEGSYHG